MACFGKLAATSVCHEGELPGDSVVSIAGCTIKPVTTLSELKIGLPDESSVSVSVGTRGQDL